MIFNDVDSVRSTETTEEDHLRVINKGLEVLIGPEGWGWIRFGHSGSNAVIEVSIDNDVLSVNIPHFERGGLLPRLSERGFSVPSAFRVAKDRKRGLFSGGYLQIDADVADWRAVASFVAIFGQSQLAWKQGREIMGVLQRR